MEGVNAFAEERSVSTAIHDDGKPEVERCSAGGGEVAERESESEGEGMFMVETVVRLG